MRLKKVHKTKKNYEVSIQNGKFLFQNKLS